MVRAGLCVAISVALMAPLVVMIQGMSAASSIDQQASSGRFVEPQNCRPEPAERAAFLASVLILPCLVFGVTALTRRLGNPSPRVADLASLAMLGVVATFCLYCLRIEKNYSLRMNEFFRHPTPSIYALLLTALLLIWGRRRNWTSRLATHLAAASSIVAVALLRVFDERSSYVWVRTPFGWGDHFSAVYHPVVQAYLGRTVLVDQASQYGLYPHAISPIFAVFGPSVLTFTLVMAGLVAIVLGMLWAFLCRNTENRVVTLIGLLAVVANGSFVLVEMKDVYFQYMPIRMIFPAASLWLCGRFLADPSRKNYAATMGVLAIGILWNLDAGVPAMASWLGVLCYRELTNPGLRRQVAGIAGHLAAGLLAVFLSVLAYSLFAFARTGRMPDFAAFFAYQKMFYVSGFYMLPMPTAGGWCIVALIYLAGLAYAARALFASQITPRSSLVLQLSILGVGLLAYYQGRSHQSVLTLAWWPSVLLLTIGLDELVATPRSLPGRVPRLAWMAALVWILAGSAWSMASFPRMLPGWYRDHLIAAMNPGPSPIAEDVDRLQSAIRAGERVLIVSRDEAIFNAKLSTASNWRSSLAEAILVEDFRAMAGRIGRREFDRIYVDRSVLNEKFASHRGFAELAETVDRVPGSESTSRGFLIRNGNGLSR